MSAPTLIAFKVLYTGGRDTAHTNVEHRGQLVLIHASSLEELEEKMQRSEATGGHRPSGHTAYAVYGPGDKLLWIVYRKEWDLSTVNAIFSVSGHN